MGTATVGRKRKDPPKTPSGRVALHWRALLDARGLSSLDLAQRIGKSRSTVDMWLRGEVLPPVDDWPAIAKAFGVKLPDLLPGK